MEYLFKKLAVITSATLVFVVWAATPVLADESETTQAVLNHHLESFGTANMQEFLSDYTDTSVIMVPSATIVGPAAFEPVAQGLFDEFSQEGTTFTMIDMQVNGHVAYIVWSAETPDNVYELATDTFVIEDGKIAYQTFAAKVTPK